MKKLFFICAAITTIIIACDNRKDIVSELQKEANVEPILELRKLNSGKAFSKAFVDTSISTTTGYRLEYRITDQNIDKNSLTFSCISNCYNVTYTIKTDSNFVLIYAPTGASYNFEMRVSDIHGKTAMATFTLVSQNKKPSLTIKSILVSANYSTTISDSLNPSVTPTYKLDYLLDDDNSSANNIVIAKQTAGDVTTYQLSTSTNSIEFNFTGTTVNKKYTYAIYITDQLGKTSDTCKFTIFLENKKPEMFIKSPSLGGGFVKSITDSLKTLLSNKYTLNFNIVDDNSSYTGITIVKKTSGDNSVITTTSSGIEFNYATASLNKQYQYGIFVVDQQGKNSDTATFDLYVFKNRLPVVVGYQGAVGSSTTTQRTDSYLSKYTNGGMPPYNAFKYEVNVNTYDKDFNFNGYVTKIKWQVQGKIYYAGNYYDYNEVFINNHTNLEGPIYNLTYYSTGYKQNNSYPGIGQNPGGQLVTATVYDNDGDSTVYSQIVVY